MIKIKVSDAAHNGTLAVTLAEDSEAVEFTNTYDAAGEITIGGTKVLENRDFKAGDQWTFTISGSPLPKDADGKDISEVTITPTSGTTAGIDFGTFKYTLADLKNEDGTYAKSKTFTYTITESGEVTGVTNDQDADRVLKITVTDNGTGTLAVVKAEDSEAISFVNTHNVEGETTITGIKTLVSSTGGSLALEKDQFTFSITPDPGNKEGVDEKELKKTASNDENGGINFGTLKFTKEGTWTYVVKETSESGSGITVDPTEYTVVITAVDKDHTGEFDVSKKITAKNGEEVADVTVISFTNTYAAKGNGEICVQKVIDGREEWTVDDKFTFTLTAVTEGAPMPAETTLEITKDTQDHLKSFGTIEFTKEGTYTYTVKEEKGDAKGMTYDLGEHTVTFTVVDNGKGKIEPATEGESMTKAVTITNTYTEVKVEKVDDSKKPVKGAVLAVKDSTGKIVDQWTTDGTVHDVQNLMPNSTYTLTELKVPEGYEKSADITFSTGKDTRVQALVMVDKKVVVPNTGDTNNTAGWTAGMIGSMLIALAAFLMRRKYGYR